MMEFGGWGHFGKRTCCSELVKGCIGFTQLGHGGGSMPLGAGEVLEGANDMR